MASTFSTEQTLKGNSFKIVDGRGRPAPIEGNPVVASSDETVARATAPADDGQGNWTFDVESVAEGTARIVVTADADLGEGVNELQAILEVEVTLDPRTSERRIEITAGQATDEA